MARVVQVDDLLRSVMTRGDVARYLQVSIATVRRCEGVDLHPKRIGNAYVFDSKEVEALGRKKAARAYVLGPREGELAARAFELFDASKPFREIVKELKCKPDKVKDWYVLWRTPIEEAYAQVVAEKKAKAQRKAQRAHERMLASERQQDKHELEKFKTEMDVINNSLRGKK